MMEKMKSTPQKRGAEHKHRCARKIYECTAFSSLNFSMR